MIPNRLRTAGFAALSALTLAACGGEAVQQTAHSADVLTAAGQIAQHAAALTDASAGRDKMAISISAHRLSAAMETLAQSASDPTVVAEAAALSAQFADLSLAALQEDATAVAEGEILVERAQALLEDFSLPTPARS